MPLPANDQAPPFAPGSRASSQSLLQDRLQLIDTLTGSLNRATTPGSPYYDLERAERLRGLIASASADAQSFRQNINQMTPQGMTGLVNSPPGPSAAMPLMSPTLVTRPGSGGLFNEEDYLQRQRENLQPPGQND